ncbi:MAG: AraC family transcriptional regulator [Rariglobus sp.]
MIAHSFIMVAISKSAPPRTRMASLLSELAQGRGFSASRLPGVKFMRATEHVPPTPITYEPSIVIVAQGRKTGRLGERTFVYDANNYLVLTAPLPFECETFGTPENPLLGLSIAVTPALVAELLVQIEFAPADTDARPQAIESAPIDDALGNAAVRLLECLHSPDDARILGPQIIREITYRVLTGPLGANLRGLATPQSHFGQITRVLNRLHADYARNFDMETLAREAGMSVSTFHAHFKNVTASSPLQYLKTIRLHKARMLMVHDGLSAAGAALQVGYESASQFSREFKRHFGGAPAEIATQLRASLMRFA